MLSMLIRKQLLNRVVPKQPREERILSTMPLPPTSTRRVIVSGRFALPLQIL